MQIVFLLMNQTLGYLRSLPIGQTTMFDEGLWYGVLIIKPWQIAASVYLHQNQEIVNSRNQLSSRHVLIKEVWTVAFHGQHTLHVHWTCNVSLLVSQVSPRLIYIYISNDHINVIFNLCQYVCVVHMSQMGGGRGHKSLEQAVSAHWASLLASTLNWITLVWETCGCNIWCWGNKRRNKLLQFDM